MGECGGVLRVINEHVSRCCGTLAPMRMSEFVKTFLSFSFVLECYCAVFAPGSTPLGTWAAEAQGGDGFIDGSRQEGYPFLNGCRGR